MSLGGRLGLAGALLLAGGRAALAQCAMCQATLVGSAEGRALGAPLNHAILLLFAAPYLVLGTFVALAFRQRITRRVARALAIARIGPAVRRAHR